VYRGICIYITIIATGRIRAFRLSGSSVRPACVCVSVCVLVCVLVCVCVSVCVMLVYVLLCLC
jgi:hypothetical protein